MKSFDILIIGAGHGGVEACAISSKFNLKVGLITLPGVPIASAPCNPCVGGVGKGQVVRELDALGGIMGELADRAGIQYRTLNESKGYAVHSTRVQIDKTIYPKEAQAYLENLDNVEIIFEKVKEVKKEEDFFIVKTDNEDCPYRTKKIIMTVGTFLNGKLHTGNKQRSGGRMDTEASASMMDLFSSIKILSNRFKTGTPARIYTSSVDFTKAQKQPSDEETMNFHWKHFDKTRVLPQVSCYLTKTNEKTISKIAENKEKSPMFNGQIAAVGARYCPSIEDKVFRYPEKHTHHVFLEPEGLEEDTIYPSGISTSLPQEIQKEFIQTISGLEKAEIKHYGYAVEYDVIDTTELNYSLEHSQISGLYFAGQVNGTSGYEEAAGQGFIAGVNAALNILGKEPFVLSRYDAYIGVMIEDLITATRDEPYRLFTARSENRLYIREDNVYRRMSFYRKKLGFSEELDMFHVEHEKKYDLLLEFLEVTRVSRESSLFNLDIFEKYKSFNNKITLSELIRWSQIEIVSALELVLKHFQIEIDFYTIKSVAIAIKYDGYIKRSESQQKKVRKLENVKIDWKKLCQSENISFECKERIKKIRPETFGQLKQMEGIRQATLAVVAGELA